MKTVKKERDITWDIVRGIGILLVLVGHSGCPIILKNFIYLFHMGLFLFVSGLFITPPSPSENGCLGCIIEGRTAITTPPKPL